MSSTKTRETAGGWWFYSGYSYFEGRYCYYSYDFGRYQSIKLVAPVYADNQMKFIRCAYWGDAVGRVLSSSEPSESD